MPFIIDVASAVVHRLIGAAFVQASPFTDVLVAWDMEGGTVLYDLDQDTAVQILPVQARVHRWLDGSRVLVTVEGSGDSAASPWVTGVYEIDLAGMTASLLSTVSPRSGELSPAGDRWLSVTQQTGKWAVQVRDVDGTNVRNVY